MKKMEQQSSPGNEAAKLLELIDDKKNRLAEIKAPNEKNRLESEIEFLERRIFPIVLRGSSLYLGQTVRTFEEKLEKAVDAGYDAILCFAQLSDGAGDNFKIGFFIPETGLFDKNLVDNVTISAELTGKDGRKINPEFLPL